ncbi:reverse transcriptase [Phytophthora megakarya]|uniref:Reverse transcriptase n=1 Tax=Phytophthora megakarya TaxID=4795 RepID=A0A225URD6_9STRA|nr:reverse transcriptase [Phytophthora megakarya]
MKKYLSGSITDLTQAEARSYGKITADYEVDEQDLLFYCPPTSRSGDDRDRLMRLVVPENATVGRFTPLPHYVGRRTSRSGANLPADQGSLPLERIIPERLAIGGGMRGLRNRKRKTGDPGRITRNLQATYSFQIIAMDHYPDHTKETPTSSSRSAQTVAESYEECVFRRFGTSEMIRHDREPGFMSDFLRAFNKILGQRQRATMAYRPQANGTAERMVQTATRVLKMYVRDLDQKDWDEYAERLTFAINTAHDRIRGDTPHYLVHGWDPRST